MATADTSEIEKFFKKIMDTIESREQMLKLGGFTIKLIQDRTRGEGKGVSQPGGPARKLKRVSPEYAEKRRKMKGKHPEASIGDNSNLTLFGPLLSTMIVRRATKKDLVLGFRSPKQDDVAEGQEKQGRRFMVLSGVEMRKATEFLANLVAKEVK